MIFGGIISLVLVLLAMFLLWSQNSRIKILEFELRALQKAFMAMRDRLGDQPAQKEVGGLPEITAAPAVAEGQEASSVFEEPPAGDGAEAETPVPAAETEDEVVSEEPEPVLAAASVAPDAVSAPTDQVKSSGDTRPDIESALGGRWAVWVGGLALALGGVFLVRYSIEAGLLGPGVRLLLASMLGLAALAGGEFLRRSGLMVPIGGVNGAYLPGILTAAGAFILFGSVFAAHGLYGFIGQASAFVLLGAIGLATIALSLIHGQAFGGLGLLGSLATPALVASDSPKPWALFGFLAIVLAATAFIARIGKWWPMMTAAIAGTGLWCLAYLFNVPEISISATVFIAVVPIAVLLFIWTRESSAEFFDHNIFIPTLAVAILAGLEVLALAFEARGQADTNIFGIVIIATALVLAACWKPNALPLLVAAGVSTMLWQLWAYFGDFDLMLAIDGVIVEGEPETSSHAIMPASWIAAGLFLLAGIGQAGRVVGASVRQAAVWALFAALVPLLVTTLIWTGFGNINRDFGYAAIFLVLAAALAAGAELAARREVPEQTGSIAVSVFSAGAMTGLLLGIHAGFGPGMTTVVCGIAIAAPVIVLRLRVWPVLPVLSVATSFVVVGRMAIDPSIVGEFDLGTTLVFNWLLPGYAIPALAAAYSAWQLRKLAEGRMRLVQEAFAALFALLTLAILVRHAMNGGKIYGDSVSLAEQAIYTLIAIGGGAILVALDTRSPSPVFRIGSMVVGGLSMLFIVISHFVALNPLVTNESTGTITFFNLLLLAYLLPAAAMAGLALYARPKRSQPYVACLGLAAAALAFAYVSLSIRRLYWGEFIGAWKGMTEWETYTYSAAWLALGVAILIVGILLRSTTLRLASAALIVIAVAKVFLFDMSQLEGVLRALSFIGLGAVLIGIGIFYQRMMAGDSARSAKQTETDEPAQT